MVKPVHIFIGGQELTGYTNMTLSRDKGEMTGMLDVNVFMGYIPTAPVLVNVARGQEVTVYIGGHLAFIGEVDRRTGNGVKSAAGESTQTTSASVNIGPNSYEVNIKARGKTKKLIDSSHQHPTTNMRSPTNREVIEKLVEPWGIPLDWKATNIDLDIVRFRDGARVVDEVFRVGLENAHFIYETRDGKLRVTDDTGQTTGEPIVLGTNILTFSATQAEDKAKSSIKVKGQRTKRDIWGEDALIETIKEIKDEWVQNETPIIVQHYGDATPEALDRRAKFEANKRSVSSKDVKVEVFHVQTTSGEPWDIGQLHYIEVPPEGIYDVMECTRLTYHVDASGTLKTSLSFSPVPSTSSGSSGGSLLAGFTKELSDVALAGATRRAAAGVTFATGQFPSPWSGPVLSVIQNQSPAALAAIVREVLDDVVTSGSQQAVPLTLPRSFQGADET